MGVLFVAFAAVVVWIAAMGALVAAVVGVVDTPASAVMKIIRWQSNKKIIIFAAIFPMTEVQHGMMSKGKHFDKITNASWHNRQTQNIEKIIDKRHPCTYLEFPSEIDVYSYLR